MAGSIKGITIQIGADTTKLTTALSQAEKSIKSTQTQLNAVEKALKLDPGNVDLLRDKQGLLAAKIQETKDKLETLKEAQRQMDASGVEKNSEEYRALQTEIDLTESKLKGLNKEMREFGSAGAQAVAEAGRKIEKFGQGMASVGDKLTRTVTMPIMGVGAAAVKVTADFDSSMSNVAAISGATGEDFDALRAKAREMGSQTKFSASEAADAMSYMAMAGWKTEDMLDGVSGIMNLAAASGEELATTSDIVTDALSAFGLTASDSGHFADVLAATAANANTNVSMMGETFKYCAPTAGALGYSIEDVSVAIGLMGNSGIKASQAGTSLNNIFTRMAKEPKEAAAAMDRLGLSLYDDEGRMYSFKEIMEQMRGSFGQINMSVEDFNAQVAELDAALEDGSITETKYNSQLEELIKQAYGAEGAEKARAAAMLAGQRGMSGLLAIVNASEEDWNKLNDAVGSASDTIVKTADGSIMPLNEALASGAEIVEQYEGQAEAMAAVMQDNLGGQATILKSQLEELAISFGDMLMPTIRDVVSGIQGFVDKLNNMDEGTREMIIKIGLFAAALGPVMSVGGNLIRGFGKVLQFAPSIVGAISTVATFIGGTMIPAIGSLIAAAAPILAAAAPFIAVGAAIVGAGVLIYKNWDKIKEKAGQLKDWVSEKWSNLKEKTAETWSNIKESVSEKWNGIKEKVASSQFGQTVGKVWDAAKTTMSNSLAAMKSAYDSHGGGLKGAVAATMEGIKQKYEAGWNFADNLTGGKLSDMANNVKTKVGEMKDAFANSNLGITVGAVWDVVKKTATDAMGNIKNAYEEHGGGMKGIAAASMEAIKQKVTLGWNFADNFTGGKLSDISSKVNDKMTAVSDKVNEKLGKVKDYFSTKLTNAAQTADAKLTTVKNYFTTKMSDAANTAIQKLELVKTYFTSKLASAAQTADSKLTSIKGYFNTKMTEVSDKVSEKLENVKTYFTSKLAAAASTADSKLTSIKGYFNTKMTEVSDKVSEKLELVKTHFSSKMESARSTADSKLSTIKSAFESKMGSVSSTVSSKMEKVRKAFDDKINAAHKVVSDVIDKIKKLFDIKLKLDIKLPHISVSGGKAPYGIGGKGKLPSFSVDWYDKGGIFDSPSIIGVGEKRPEFVGALDDLRQIVREESGAGAGSELLEQMQIMTDYMAAMLRELSGARPITVKQEIYANETSYSEQQKAAAREFKAIARTI